MDDGVVPIADAAEREAVRRQGRSVAVKATLAAAALTAAYVALTT
jgi:hypothetical protein